MRVLGELELGTGPLALEDDLVIEAENSLALAQLPSEAFDLIYIDPPFNTGRAQQRRTMTVERDEAEGDRTGFGGRRYRSSLLRALSYEDSFGSYLEFLAPRLEEARRVLA